MAGYSASTDGRQMTSVSGIYGDTPTRRYGHTTSAAAAPVATAASVVAAAAAAAAAAASATTAAAAAAAAVAVFRGCILRLIHGQPASTPDAAGRRQSLPRYRFLFVFLIRLPPAQSLLRSPVTPADFPYSPT